MHADGGHTTTPRTIGFSRQGRAIELLEFPGRGAGGGAPRLLVFGGIHGDEPASTEAVRELAERLGHPRSPPLPSGDPVWLVPALNPDGLDAARKNAASDVDLNRNFPAKSFTRTHPPGYDPGPHPLSEPETALFARIVNELGVGAIVAVHAPFACVNFDGPAESWAAAVASACGWPVRTNIGYPTPGSLGSWLGIDRGLPVLTLELPPGPLAAFRPAANAALDRAIDYWNEPNLNETDGDRRKEL